MRVKTRKVLKAFMRHKECTPDENYISIWTDGETIFSYYTAIATRVLDSKGIPHLLLNGTDYSPTTTDKQNSIAAWFHTEHIPIIYLTDLDMGIKRDKLIEYARIGSHSKTRLH